MSSRPSSVADRPADRTCERCGASFKYPMLLKRHKERKNPCTQPAAIPEEPAAPPAAEAAASAAALAPGDLPKQVAQHGVRLAAMRTELDTLKAASFFLLKNLKTKKPTVTPWGNSRNYSSSQRSTVKVSFAYNEYKDHFFQKETKRQPLPALIEVAVEQREQRKVGRLKQQQSLAVL